MSLNRWLVVGVLVIAGYRLGLVLPGRFEREPAREVALDLDDALRFTRAHLSEGQLTLIRVDGTSTVLRHPRLKSFAWDKNAAVYVTAGSDEKPGVRGVDDEGNGIVDDRSELGATGSDDLILTPTDPSYEDARQGKVIGFVISRGAMIPTPKTTTLSAPTQIRIDLLDDQKRLVSRIIDLTDS